MIDINQTKQPLCLFFEDVLLKLACQLATSSILLFLIEGLNFLLGFLQTATFDLSTYCQVELGQTILVACSNDSI